MRAFALDDAHDLYLRNGQIAVIDGADSVVQAIRTRLLLYRGEWWLDLDAGTPWFQEILVKPADLAAIEGTLKRQILDTPGVESLISFAAIYEPRTRELKVSFEALTEYGPSGVESVVV